MPLEIRLLKKWFPLILLIVFTAVSVAALSGLARNVAQKRTLVSDPLYRVVWKKKKSHRVMQNMAHARKLNAVKH